jgi:hypothetical protein
MLLAHTLWSFAQVVHLAYFRVHLESDRMTIERKFYPSR